MNLDNINKAAKKAFGNDMRISIARSVSFGHDDNLIIVSGKRHAEAAAGIAMFARDAKVEVCTSSAWDHGDAYKYTTIQYFVAA